MSGAASKDRTLWDMCMGCIFIGASHRDEKGAWHECLKRPEFRGTFFSSCEDQTMDVDRHRILKHKNKRPRYQDLHFKAKHPQRKVEAWLILQRHDCIDYVNRDDVERELESFRSDVQLQGLCEQDLRDMHRYYHDLEGWEKEHVSVLRRCDQPYPDKMRQALYSLECTKRKEGFLWLEILSFSDESFVRSIQPSPKQGELCLF